MRGAQHSTLGNRSKGVQDRRLPASFEHRFNGAFPFIPTYNVPVPLTELQSWAQSAEELQRMVPILRDLKENGRVIACLTWIVDPVTGKTVFLYLADRYRDETDQYENDLSLGDPAKWKTPATLA